MDWGILAGMIALPRSRSCFGCGMKNPLGLDLAPATDGSRVEIRFRFRPEYAGFRNTVHGGILSTALDEVMAWVCGVAAHQFAYCAELNVRFLRPVVPEEDVLGVGELVENRRGRLFSCRAELLQAGVRCAEATGKYLPVDRSVTEALKQDFEEDPTAFFATLKREGQGA